MTLPFPFEIVIFAVIAAVVLFQLYNVLGKKVGRQPEQDAKPMPHPLPGGGQQRAEQPAAPLSAQDRQTHAAATELKSRDPSFDPVRFLEGARQAYEAIVRAFAAGDVETLRPLLAPRVLESFEQAINARAPDHRESVEFVEAPRLDLERAYAENDQAMAAVRFLAEIRTTLEHTTPEPSVSEKRTAEIWTFQRAIGASDPNWRLVGVRPATA